MTDNGEGKETDIVLLVDEEGNEHEFHLVDRFEVNQGNYAILVPVNNNVGGDNGEAFEQEGEAYIFRIDDNDGEELLVEVEDENEWKKVADFWEDRIQGFEYDD
ncbi:MAG: DUF1292 domain-containing protein [Bacillota bacterium]